MSGASWNRFAGVVVLTLYEVSLLDDLCLLSSVVVPSLLCSLWGSHCLPFLELPEEWTPFFFDAFVLILFSLFLCFCLHFFVFFSVLASMSALFAIDCIFLKRHSGPLLHASDITSQLCVLMTICSQGVRVKIQKHICDHHQVCQA